MSFLLKIAILASFLFVIFGQNLFPSRALYWATYFFMFALIPLLWEAMFWVSKKRATKVLNADSSFDSFFVGLVSQNVNADLTRGRLCFYNGKITLIGKQKNDYTIVFEIDSNNIASIGFSKVAGVRKGFTLHMKNGEQSDMSFVSANLFKHRDLLYTALNWEISKS